MFGRTQKTELSRTGGLRLFILLLGLLLLVIPCLTACAQRRDSGKVCIVSAVNGSTKLYEGQGGTGRVLSVLENGEEVVLLSRSGLYAQVKTTGKGKTMEGFVLDGSVSPKEDTSLQKLRVVDVQDALYTYDEMLADIDALKAEYPSLVRVYDLTITADGRRVPVMEIGSAEASRHILLHASIHAREYMTSQLLMAQAEAALQEWEDNKNFRDVCFHVIPMVNPDGVSISQFGPDGIRDTELRERVRTIAENNKKPEQTVEDYCRLWKANARGVDLNSNFDGLWTRARTTERPSGSGYKGTEPLSEIESQALVEYTLKQTWDLTISYHAYGSILYWEFLQEGNELKRTRSLLEEVRNVTGYTEAEKMTEENFSCGGYKDWALQALNIPSLTMEIGTCPCPLPSQEFPSIWDRTGKLWDKLAQWADKQ